MIKIKIKDLMIDVSFYIIGSVVYSLGVVLFISNNQISPGGFTGLATIINSLFSIPISTTFFLLNIPLIIIAYFKLGKELIIKSAITTLLLSLIMDVFEKFIHSIAVNKSLAIIYGGLMMGTGIGIILLKGATTGGVDIIAKLIIKNHEHITFGKIILCFDFLVLMLNLLIYKSLETFLYSLITMYITSKVADIIVYGNDKGKIAFIISKNSDQISNEILSKLSRGTTKISVLGGYSKEKKEMIICTIRPYEISVLNSIIKDNDKNAFIILSSADVIYGNGFKNI